MLRPPSSELQHVRDTDVAWCCAAEEYFDVKELKGETKEIIMIVVR